MNFFQRATALLPALLTPFDAKGEINFQALARLVDREIAEGADGIYALGSTAEAYLLSHEERKETLEAIVRAVAGRVPVIAQVGSPSQREACALAEHAAGLGVNAVSSVPPFYYTYSMAELQSYYFAVARACALPVLVYNIPDFTGVTFTMENAGDLLRDRRILGVKHTDFNLYTLGQIKSSCPDKLILNGHEECMLASLMMGADGGIGSSFNCLGPIVYALRDAYLAGDYESAKDIQRKLNAYVSMISAAGGFKAIKYLVRLQGIDCGECREPYAPISGDGRRLMEQLMEKLSNEWGEGR